jgi:hypothetical protein
MKDKLGTKDYVKGRSKMFRNRSIKRHPPVGLVEGADYFWRLLLPEVLANSQWMPSWLMALKCLCNLLCEEKVLLDKVLISGAMSKDCIKLEMCRARIAQFSNYVGISKFLVAPAVPSYKERIRNQKSFLYDRSVMKMLGSNIEEENIPDTESDWS